MRVCRFIISTSFLRSSFADTRIVLVCTFAWWRIFIIEKVTNSSFASVFLAFFFCVESNLGEQWGEILRKKKDWWHFGVAFEWVCLPFFFAVGGKFMGFMVSFTFFPGWREKLCNKLTPVYIKSNDWMLITRWKILSNHLKRLLRDDFWCPLSLSNAWTNYKLITFFLSLFMTRTLETFHLRCCVCLSTCSVGGLWEDLSRLTATSFVNCGGDSSEMRGLMNKETWYLSIDLGAQLLCSEKSTIFSF